MARLSFPSFSSSSPVSALGFSLSLVAACAALSGCAAGASEGSSSSAASDALVSTAVVVADTQANAAAEVLSDRVRLPLSVADRYRTLAAGNVFVGARGAANGKNPDGFLRKVSSVTVDGDSLVIMTTPASLTDAIVRGALRTSSGGGAIDEGESAQSLTPLSQQALRGVAIDFSDKPLFDGTDDVVVAIPGARVGKKARFTESIRLDRAVLTAQPVVQVDMRIDDGKVGRFIAEVQGNFDTSVLATATVTGEGDLDEQTLAELQTKKHDVRRVVYQSPREPLPTIAVGGVPISPSVQITVTLACTLAFGGPLVAHAGVEAKSYVRLGAVYDGGAWQQPIRSDFAIKPSFSLEHGGQIDARCAIETRAELFAFGTSSVSMSVAPHVDFGVKAETPSGYPFRVSAGATGAMSGQSDAFGLSPRDLERTVTEWTAPSILEGVSP